MIKDNFIKKLLIVNAIFLLIMCLFLVLVSYVHKSKPQLTEQLEQKWTLGIESKTNIEDLKKVTYHCMKIIKSCDKMTNALSEAWRWGPVIAIIFFIINISILLFYSKTMKLKFPE